MKEQAYNEKRQEFLNDLLVECVNGYETMTKKEKTMLNGALMFCYNQCGFDIQQTKDTFNDLLEHMMVY